MVHISLALTGAAFGSSASVSGLMLALCLPAPRQMLPRCRTASHSRAFPFRVAPPCAGLLPPQAPVPILGWRLRRVRGIRVGRGGPIACRPGSERSRIAGGHVRTNE